MYTCISLSLYIYIYIYTRTYISNKTTVAAGCRTTRGCASVPKFGYQILVPDLGIKFGYQCASAPVSDFVSGFSIAHLVRKFGYQIRYPFCGPDKQPENQPLHVKLVCLISFPLRQNAAQ